MKDLENLLNEQQFKAVTTKAQNVRIIAGAGSGKTRVLTYRIAYLIEEMGVKPYNILAITFTNKVAKEMQERTIRLIEGYDGKHALSIMTYHKFCAYFLRREIANIGYPANYQIFDEEDQKTIVKNIAVANNYSKGDEIIKKAIAYISEKKTKGLYPQEIKINPNDTFPQEKELLKFYFNYEEIKSSYFGLDFDDLINRTIQILEMFPNIREKWRNYYKHILIDEFQDTNDMEYHLVQLLLNDDTSLYVVGDPDQTIYTWRGANQKIIINSIANLPNLETVILDVNYRSTKNILDCANALISHNKSRIKKDLRAFNEEGKKVECKCFPDKKSEGKYICDVIKQLKREDEDFSYQDVAILYRASYLSLKLETELLAARIPYIIYGGLKFFQRKEVKDTLAYFRLLLHPEDDFSLYRIINDPRRSIGDVSIENLKRECKENKMKVLEYIGKIEDFNTNLSNRVVLALERLNDIIKKYRQQILVTDSWSRICEILSLYLDEIGYIDYINDLENGDERVENVMTLKEDISTFLKSDSTATLEEYFQNVALLSAQDEIKDNEFIKLMTIHTAKGLEFKYVFVVDVNENIFPSGRALLENPFDGEEEERRLCYVAFTRAKKQLYVTYTNDFNFMDKDTLKVSRFIKEANLFASRPIDNYQNKFQHNIDIREELKRKVESNKALFAKNNIVWAVGDYVSHPKFGIGIITAIEKDVLIIKFSDEFGEKKMLSSFGALKKHYN